MKKVIIKILAIISIVLFMIKSDPAKASQEAVVNLIFDKVSYSSNETIRLTINLENFVNLNETRLMIKVDETKLEPLKINNQYGQLLKSSIYEESLLNEYISGGYLRFYLVKKSLETGYYSGYKNNIGEFYFESKSSISNIYELFQDISFETAKSGINIKLYDIYSQTIEYKIKYSEKIKIVWEKEKYIMEVYSPIPKYENDIKVLNRDSSQYEIIYQSDIDNTKLSTGVINVVILDNTNGDYILLAKSLDVVDSLAPVINGEHNITIDSTNIDLFDELELIEVTDNFDLNPVVDILYYDINDNLFADRIKFIDYLKHNSKGYLKIIARDSSSNISDEFIINININDNTPPVVTIINNYDLIDLEFDNFKFEDLITVIDDYDNNPKLYYECYLDGKIVNCKEQLKKGNHVLIKYYASDNMNNQTKEYSCIVKLVDTQNPIVNQIDNIEINDTMVTKYDFLGNITFSDNLDENPTLVVNYYLNEQEVSYEEWIKGIAKSGKGTFTYYVKDKSQNMSEKFNIQVNVIDTTPPIIRVHNIKNNAKYTKLDKIDYEIIDNFGNIITKVISINNEPYSEKTINDPGEYELKIIATDGAGNTSEYKVKFTIIKNNFIGCGDDIECYTNNYLDVVIIACILMIVVMTIIIVKVCLIYRKKKLR